MIRISSGLLRGITLRSPTGPQTRPSSERLRQGTFNVLRHFREVSVIEEAVIVDLFAGTGAWGIEALSNGAREVWFIEAHKSAQLTLDDNVAKAIQSFKSQHLEPPVTQIVRQDASVIYKKLPIADVIFCDPPYQSGWFEKVIRLEQTQSRLAANGLFLYEAEAREPIPHDIAPLKLFDTKIYGDSAVHFFVKEA